MNAPLPDFLGERPLMTSYVFWPFLTYLPYLFLYHPIFGGYFTLKLDVIYGRSPLESYAWTHAAVAMQLHHSITIARTLPWMS